ncbi:MAG: hypothetical protein KAU20_07680 [Nanoarchaeota archaeon]|nr:hypothetical protein [Nanoarchaeota archaeon]
MNRDTGFLDHSGKNIIEGALCSVIMDGSSWEGKVCFMGCGSGWILKSNLNEIYMLEVVLKNALDIEVIKDNHSEIEEHGLNKHHDYITECLQESRELHNRTARGLRSYFAQAQLPITAELWQIISISEVASHSCKIGLYLLGEQTDPKPDTTNYTDEMQGVTKDFDRISCASVEQVLTGIFEEKEGEGDE